MPGNRKRIHFHWSATVALVALLGMNLGGCQTGPISAADAERGPAPPFASPSFDQQFWSHWSDGKGELYGYDLTISRYRESRKGVAVTIFVTEPFSREVRVKADPGKHPKEDEFPVMKLNLVEDFPTGIYDYNWMTSSFLALVSGSGRPAGFPSKVSFSSQEWCGHVYSQLLFDAASIRRQAHSYFDAEADQEGTVDYPADGIAEDALWFWARGMAAPKLEPGASAQVKLLLSLQKARASHEALVWQPATLSRSAATESVRVPGGSFTVEKWTAAADGGVTRTFYVEAEFPHRIVKWETDDGEVAEMLAGDRLPYWQMHGEEFASAVETLGLSPRPPRTP